MSAPSAPVPIACQVVPGLATGPPPIKVLLFISHTDTAPVFLFCSRMSAKAILIENRRLRSPAMPFQDWG
jgi:hypothetical protein